MKKKKTASIMPMAIILGGAALSAIVLAQGVSAQDRQFTTDVAKGGMTEVHVAKMGIERAMSQAVKGFWGHTCDCCTSEVAARQ